MMDRYMVISPHTAEDCVKAISRVEAAGYITHFDWGCKGGDHTGWTIVEADSAPEALMVVPSLERGKARAVKLTKFAPGDLKGAH